MLDYIFGPHVDSSVTGPVSISGVNLDPKGYSIEAYLTTLDENSIYLLGRFKSNPNESVSLTPNLRFARLVNARKTYKAKMDRYPAGTRLRFKWVYDGSDMIFMVNTGLDGFKELGREPCDHPIFGAWWLFTHKSKCLCSRVVIRDHEDTIANDLQVVENQLQDIVGEINVRTDTTEGIRNIHAITDIEDDGELTLGKTLSFKTSDGFEVEQVLLNDKVELDFKDGIKIPLGDVDHLPHLGPVTLTAKGKDGAVFTMDAELVAPEGWEVIEYGPTENGETSLTYQVKRHPVKGDMVLYAPTDDVRVDEYNVIHPIAEKVDHTFYVIDKGGMFIIDIDPEVKLINPPPGPPMMVHRDFTGFDIGESVIGKTGFSSDARNAKLTDEYTHLGKPAVKLNMYKGRTEWAWGGVIKLPRDVVKGETILISFPMAVPKETNIFSSDNYNTKWFRCSFQTHEGKKAPYADIYIHNKEGDSRQFAYILEGHNKWHMFGDKNNPEDSIVHDNEIAYYQMMITLDDKSVDDGGKGRVRFYKDGNLVKGGDITNRPTMLDPRYVMDGFYLGTYWNGKVPKDQHVYMSDLRIATVSEADGVDADGFPILKDLDDDTAPTPTPKPVEPEPTPTPVEPDPEPEPTPVEPEEPIEPAPLPGEPSNPEPGNPIKVEDTLIKLEQGASVTITRGDEGIELLIRKPQ